MDENKRSKTFLTYFLISFGVFNLAWFALVVSLRGQGGPGSLFLQTFLVRKFALAKSVKSPKIIFLSGSSYMYGVNSKEVEDKLKIPAVNLGVPLDFGLTGVLQIAKDFAKSNDTIVLTLDYPFFVYSTTASALAFLTMAPQLISSFTAQQQLQMLYGVPASWVGRKIWQKLDPQPQREVAADKMLEYTDRGEIRCNPTVSWEQEPRNYLFDEVPRNHPAWQGLTQFFEFCSLNKIRVVIVPPPLLYSKYFEQRPLKLWEQIVSFAKSQNIPVLEAQRDEFYAPNYMCFDYSHLTEKGAEIRTQKLILALEGSLGVKKF